MAVDQVLLESLASSESEPDAILRVYRWSTPYLSIGYFQKYAELENPDDLPVVRRWTGGGTVEHGEDWTFSLIARRECSIAKLPPPETYCIIHTALAAALKDCGVAETILSKSDQPHDGSGLKCFNSPVTDDLLLNDKKIAGGAQRRSKFGLLHQGSVQFLKPPARLGSKFAQCLADSIERRSSLNDVETERSRRLVVDRYETEKWLTRR